MLEIEIFLTTAPRKGSAQVRKFRSKNQTHHYDFINPSFATLCDLCAFAVEKTNSGFFGDGNHNGSAADMEELAFLNLVSSKYAKCTKRRLVAEVWREVWCR